MVMQQVKVGDEFRCKRRGHTVQVLMVMDRLSGERYLPCAFVKNVNTNRQTWIAVYRLTKPYRFEQIVAHATIPAVAENAA